MTEPTALIAALKAYNTWDQAFEACNQAEDACNQARLVRDQAREACDQAFATYKAAYNQAHPPAQSAMTERRAIELMARLTGLAATCAAALVGAFEIGRRLAG